MALIRSLGSVLVVFSGLASVCAADPPLATVQHPTSPPIQGAVEDKPETKTLSGRVCDTKGRPITDATVWVIAVYNIRKEATFIRQASTDTAGIFHLEGFPEDVDQQRFRLPATLIAGKPGGPLTFQFVRLKTKNNTAPDIVLPDVGATLEVRVLGPDGLPQSGIPVGLNSRTAGSLLAFMSFMDSDSRLAMASLRRVLYPRATTNAAGVARFTQLLADHYHLVAARIDSDKALNPDWGNRFNDPLYGYSPLYSEENIEATVAENVPVAQLGTNRFTLRLQKTSGPMRLRFLLPDGTPSPESHLGFGLTAAAQKQNDSASGIGMSYNPQQGFFKLRPESGIWRLTRGYQNEPPPKFTSHGLALFGKTTLAFSPYRQRSEVVDIPTRPMESPRLTVHLVDEKGKPVRGVVYLGNYESSSQAKGEQRVGTTDERGYITLSHLPAGKQWIRAEALNDPPLPELDFRAEWSPLSEKDLRNRRRWPAVLIHLESTTETTITLRPERVSWLRGKIRGNYSGSFHFPPDPETNGGMTERIGTRWQIDHKTGEYLLGPLIPGPVSFTFDYAYRSMQDSVTIRPGTVHKHDISLDPTAPTITQTEEEGPAYYHSLTGSVFLPDGKTPAREARLVLFDPARVYIVPFPYTYWSDVEGKFHPASLGRLIAPFGAWYDTSFSLPSKGAKKKALLAFLPGSYGATIVELPGGPNPPTLRLVLPPALSIKGKVTVGGKPFGPSCPGVIQILAAYQGQGPLRTLLSVETTAESDGSFTLAGLTPGTYRIQATLDNIWLSPAQTVTVTADKPLSHLTLEMPEPGQPLVIELGKAYAGAQVYLADTLPEGPLSERYRAAYYVADGAGNLRLEGLPAGRHRLRLPDKRTVSATVLPYPYSPNRETNPE